MPEQKSVQIKICGITGKEEIRWLNEEVEGFEEVGCEVEGLLDGNIIVCRR